jgi:hypothetical protein
VYNEFFFPRKSFRLCHNVGKSGTPGQAIGDNIIRRMRFLCWIPKATNTHSQYVILIVFPLQNWSHEHASVLPLHLRCLSVSCLNCLVFSLRLKKETGSFGRVSLLGLDINRSVYCCDRGQAAGGAVGRGTALQVGRSRVRFPMVSFEFFIDIILLAAQWPWG